MSRPQIAFFDFHDVLEDFYPRYGVTQRAFAHSWAASGNHAWVTLLQREIGDVTWIASSMAPELAVARHELTGARVVITRSSWAHRRLWRTYYTSRHAWRWQQRYRAYGAVSSYLAPLSLSLLGALRDARPDLVMLQDYATGRYDVLAAAGRALGARVVAYHSGSDAAAYRGRVLRRATLRLADRLFVSSAAEADWLAQRFGVARDRLPVLLTPIDTEAFRPEDRAVAAARAGLPPGGRRALFLGRLDDGVKRVSALIDAIAALPDGELVVAGDGEDRAALERHAAQVAPGRVRFTGWVDGADALRALLNACDCLVLASIREGFPTVVGQALACGTPVLATRVGGVAELVQHGRTGWLVEPRDDGALRSALAEALSGDTASRMSAAARMAAEERLAPAAVAQALRRELAL
ncbi:MAG TPA: glycosyltransferase family 4 protein [Solirubrobacteraceae bacterium]|nr:glycosyltransferase family 4 protein [Solirubrobacteraceae bacterium]